MSLPCNRVRETLDCCCTTLRSVLMICTACGLLALGSLSQNAAAQTSNGERAVVQIVRLQHRDPAPIREAIAPFLDERGAISQLDNNLIISTTRTNLAELQSLILELDVPRRQLRVSVDFRYGLPARPTLSDGGVITTIATQEPTDYAVQSIVVNEGEFAHFSLLASTPRTGLRFTELGAVLSQETEQTGSTLTVSAELRRERAFLNIAATQRQAGTAQSTTVVSSTLEVDFNDWQIVSSRAIGNQNGIPANSATTQVLATTNTPEAVAVRVELLP